MKRRGRLKVLVAPELSIGDTSSADPVEDTQRGVRMRMDALVLLVRGTLEKSLWIRSKNQ
jgi:hypothetical protein